MAEAGTRAGREGIVQGVPAGRSIGRSAFGYFFFKVRRLPVMWGGGESLVSFPQVFHRFSTVLCKAKKINENGLVQVVQRVVQSRCKELCKVVQAFFVNVYGLVQGCAKSCKKLVQAKPPPL